MAEGRDRRASERFPVNLDTGCDFLSPVLEDFGPVRIKNVSTDGIGLVVSQELATGMLLAVSLANPNRSFARTVLVRVMHVTPQAGGTYLVGGAFQAPLSYDELCAMVM